MKAYKFKKYSVIFFIFISLITMLYISIKQDSIYTSVIAKESSTSTTTSSNGSNMVDLLARLINGEARGESYLGQVAVGAVVLNRVESSEFPNTISGVIYQKGQFSCITDGNFNKAIDENSTVYKAAEEAMNGADPTNGALFFYNPSTAKSDWLFELKTVTTIGNHRFAVSN